MQKSEMENVPPIKGNRLLSNIYHKCNVAVCEPADHKEVINDPKSKKAMKEEVYMIEKKKTRELVDIPRDRKVHHLHLMSNQKVLNGDQAKRG